MYASPVKNRPLPNDGSAGVTSSSHDEGLAQLVRLRRRCCWLVLRCFLEEFSDVGKQQFCVALLLGQPVAHDPHRFHALVLRSSCRPMPGQDGVCFNPCCDHAVLDLLCHCLFRSLAAHIHVDDQAPQRALQSLHSVDLLNHLIDVGIDGVAQLVIFAQCFLKEGAISDLQQFACLQAYLSFVASGQIKCSEDGGHHRPNHAANASRSIVGSLRDLAFDIMYIYIYVYIYT